MAFVPEFKFLLTSELQWNQVYAYIYICTFNSTIPFLGMQRQQEGI